jgi:uncharacterized protein YdaT
MTCVNSFTLKVYTIPAPDAGTNSSRYIKTLKMPWTKKDYPVSMKNLPEKVRNKAIEIANALLEERDMEEGIAIATAISRAKDWAVEHGMKAENRGKSKVSDVKEHGEDRYVTPYGDEWAVKVEGRKKPERVFSSKTKAVKKAKREAKEANASLTVQRKKGKIEKRVSFNPRNSGRKSTAKKRSKSKAS